MGLEVIIAWFPSFGGQQIAVRSNGDHIRQSTNFQTVHIVAIGIKNTTLPLSVLTSASTAQARKPLLKCYAVSPEP